MTAWAILCLLMTVMLVCLVGGAWATAIALMPLALGILAASSIPRDRL